MAAFAACADTSRLTKLAKPVVSSNGGFYARWTAVEGAGSYSVRVEDISSNSQLVKTSVTETSFSLAEYALQTGEREVYVYVAAIPSSDNYDASEEGKCKITIPRVSDMEMLQSGISSVLEGGKEMFPV